jgi:hypothetical protein
MKMCMFATQTVHNTMSKTLPTFTIPQQQRIANGILKLLMLSDRVHPKDTSREMFKDTANAMLHSLVEHSEKSDVGFDLLDPNRTLGAFSGFTEQLIRLADDVFQDDVILAAMEVDPLKGGWANGGYHWGSSAEE